jgi:peptidoglycan/LPS O-acetylase OafA/YrhL
MDAVREQTESEPTLVAPEVKKSGGRLEFLDAIRGIASFIVLIQHYVEQHFRSFAVEANNYISLGRAGVVTFFVVSGFVIPMSIERRGDLRAFWIARVFRLYPAYLLSMISLVICYFVLRGPTEASGMLGGAKLPDDWRTWAVNFSLLQFFFQRKIPGIRFDAENINPVAWTLGVEWMIYIGCALLFWMKGLKKMWVVAAAAFAVGFLPALYRPWKVGASGPYVEPMLIWYAVIGLAIYRVLHNETDKKTGVFWSIVMVALVGGALYLNRILHFPVAPAEFTATWITEVNSALLAFGIFMGGVALRAKAMPKWLTWLGQISYSLYLLHGLTMIIPMVIPGLMSVPYLSMLIQAAVAVGLSALCYKYIEAPGIALGKKLTPKRK